MTKPRWFELGDGRCLDAAPGRDDFEAVNAGRISPDEYRSRCESRWDYCHDQDGLAPGRLLWGREPGYPAAGNVEDGDTLICSCPRIDSPKRTRQCHLEWLAPYLVRAGWDVVLYGRLLERS
jgi:hypothetical protein